MSCDWWAAPLHEVAHASCHVWGANISGPSWLTRHTHARLMQIHAMHAELTNRRRYVVLRYVCTQARSAHELTQRTATYASAAIPMQFEGFCCHQCAGWRLPSPACAGTTFGCGGTSRRPCWRARGPPSGARPGVFRLIHHRVGAAGMPFIVFSLTQASTCGRPGPTSHHVQDPQRWEF